MQRLIKRAFDMLASASGLLALSPLFAAVAVAVKLEDGGPIFFRQQRLGRNGYPFGIWKFRSMIQNADHYIDKNGRPTKDRVTRIGRILRKTSIDELPQLINILLGDMSVVGPRPALLSHYSRYTLQQRRRLAVRPGITGLAQVNGRNTLRWSARVQYDIEYIDHYSLMLDVQIVFKTVMQVIRGQGVVMDRNPADVDDLGPAQPGIALPTSKRLAE